MTCLLELDDRRRLSLGRVGNPRHTRYLATVDAEGTITLRPAVVMTEIEARFLSNPELVHAIRDQRTQPDDYVRRGETDAHRSRTETADPGPSLTPDSSDVWDRIAAHSGATFHLIQGKAFTYDVRGRTIHLHTHTESWKISRTAIEKALDRVPLRNTVVVYDLPAPSYVYAILMDERIRASDW